MVTAPKKTVLSLSGSRVSGVFYSNRLFLVWAFLNVSLTFSGRGASLRKSKAHVVPQHIQLSLDRRNEVRNKMERNTTAYNETKCDNI